MIERLNASSSGCFCVMSSRRHLITLRFVPYLQAPAHPQKLHAIIAADIVRRNSLSRSEKVSKSLIASAFACDYLKYEKRLEATVQPI